MKGNREESMFERTSLMDILRAVRCHTLKSRAKHFKMGNILASFE